MTSPHYSEQSKICDNDLENERFFEWKMNEFRNRIDKH